MAYASQSGRARTSAKNPSAFGVCFRCGMWYNRKDLVFQFDWRGTSLRNLYVLVCTRTCLDVPQEQLRAIVLPADPVPVYFPSVEQFEAAETDYRSLAEVRTDPRTGIPVPSTTLRVTEDCQNRITQPLGCPEGLTQPAVMPYNSGIHKAFGVPLSLLSVTANGTATISVTCSKPHGLKTNDQVSAAGLSNKCADGFYSVVVRGAMAFNYFTYSNVPAGPLLAPTTRIVTALVGLPRGSETIPQACECNSTGAGSQSLLTDAGDQITTDSGVPILTSG